MKAGVASLLMAALAGSAVARPNVAPREEEEGKMSIFGPKELKATSAPKAVSMKILKQKKLDQHSKDREAGVFDLDRYDEQDATGCIDGKSGEYKCNNIDLKGFLRHQDMNSRTREGNDVWGMFSVSYFFIFPRPRWLTSDVQVGPLPTAVSSDSSVNLTVPPSSRFTTTVASATSVVCPHTLLPLRGATSRLSRTTPTLARRPRTMACRSLIFASCLRQTRPTPLLSVRPT